MSKNKNLVLEVADFHFLFSSSSSFYTSKPLICITIPYIHTFQLFDLFQPFQTNKILCNNCIALCHSLLFNHISIIEYLGLLRSWLSFQPLTLLNTPRKLYIQAECILLLGSLHQQFIIVVSAHVLHSSSM